MKCDKCGNEIGCDCMGCHECHPEFTCKTCGFCHIDSWEAGACWDEANDPDYDPFDI
ncbi:hypothetical protein [Lactococcus lactis]|uniref:hypothetical protein n=1 Tax=Lactococcus lactis TaxID=1358 RepID=UPI0032E51BA1